MEEKVVKSGRFGPADPNKVYDLRGSSFGSTRSYGVRESSSKEFSFLQRFAAKTFNAKPFGSAKSASIGEVSFATKEVDAKRSWNPFANKTATTKTMPVEAAREGSKTMPAGQFAKGQRTYRGPEADRMAKAINPDDKWVGRTTSLQPMTIEDVRELLNKNK